MSGVIDLSASYRLLSTTEATLTLEGNQQPGTVISLLHERYRREAACYDLACTFTQQLEVREGETLTIIARRHGRIVGTLPNEVDCCEESRILLVPRGGFNTIVYQLRLDDLQESTPKMRTLKVPTPSTLVLTRLTAAIKALDPTESVFKLAFAATDGAVAMNNEQHSREMLSPLLMILENYGMDSEETLQAYCAKARECLAG